jgi:zinc transporter ZupT
MPELSVWVVVFAAFLTAVATGLGVLPFLFVRDVGNWWLGIFSAVAGGLMLAASHSLMVEGSALSDLRALLGVLVGLGLIVLANTVIERQGPRDVAELAGADARKALLILGVMTAHSFAEGVGVGVSFGGGQDLGVFITAAIAVHNIPEGLAISLVLVPRGTPLWKAAGWSVFTSLPQPLMALPAFLFVLVFEPFLPVGFGLAAGAMIWMVFAELIPDALEEVSGPTVGVTVTLAFAALFAVQNFVLHV